MLTDNEIRGIAEDTLQFKAFAQTLEEIITTSETPITIGVYGAWGSGKTSLMRMTQDILKDKIKTVWFNAWKFDKTYDLRVALIHAILRRMEEDGSISPGLKDKVVELLKRVNWLGLGKAAVSSFFPLLAMLQGNEPFLKKPEEIPGKTLELIGDFEAEFKELTNEYVGDEGRLVVFIDDLDRCISEKTIDILEAIKLFLNVQHSVFVIGADKKRIEDGIIDKYKEKSKGWAGDYLEKIVQIPFSLPPLRKEVIAEEFFKQLDISDEIRKYTSILAEVGDNPRRIKRLLNSFEVKRILAEKRELEIEENIMAKLAVIEFRWHDYYTDLIGIYSETGTNLAKILKETSECEETEKEKKLKEWENLRKYFEDKRLMVFLEQEPPLWNVNLDIYVYLARSTTELKESAVNYFNIAYSLGEKGDYEKAIENYDKAIELNPNYEKAWFNKGVMLERLERYEEAMECYDKAIDLNPNYEKAWYGKGVNLGKLKRYEEAIECYDKAIDLNPNYEQAWFNKGVMLERLERYEEAMECYDKAIDLNPNYEQAWFNKGNDLGKLERYEEAIECYDKAIELNPNFEKAWHNKGNDLGKLERYEEAIECYDKAIELNPNDEEAWYGKGWNLGKLERHEEAIECYDKAIDLNPNDEEAWYGKGWNLGKLERHEEAIECYDKAIDLNPNFEEAWNSKGCRLSELEKHEEAIECYDKAIEINPNYEEAWFNKGDDLSELEKHGEAIECYDKAIELNPNFEEAWSAKGWSLGKLERHEEAIECYDKAISLNSNFEDAWSAKGWSLGKLERYEEAIECEDKAIELNSKDGEAWYNKGWSLEKLGRKDEAEHCFQKAKELGYKES